MKELIFIFAGGGLGSVSRYLLSLVIVSDRIANFPLATLTANCLSSFILGLLVTLGLERFNISEPVRLMLTVGFCGGFSTFSTFTAESYQLMKDGNFTAMAINILLSVVLCLLFLVAGIMAGKQIGH